MIENIDISKVVTFGESQVMEGLSQFNYIFGSNGTGKTTISRVIADENSYSGGKLTWKGNTKLQPMVYNHDFVERNFNQNVELKGVFTLGEEQVDTLTKIEDAKDRYDSLKGNIENLTHTLEGDDGSGGKRAELVELETHLKNKCWEKKQKYDDKFQDAFRGVRNNSENFKNRVLNELTLNKAILLPLDELESKAESVFGNEIEQEPTIDVIDITKLLAHESNPILQKKVIGKEDVDIAAMITKLGNSDWVRQGRQFYDENESVCPFCQQDTDANFAKSLNEYFDATFETDTEKIDELVTNYSDDAHQAKHRITSIIDAQSRFVNIEKLEVENNEFTHLIDRNAQKLIGKKREPSRAVKLEPVTPVIDRISSLVQTANDSINEHNNLVANRSAERSNLTSQVWKFVLEELKVDLKTYESMRKNVNSAIDSLTNQIIKLNKQKLDTESEIRQLEKQTTSVQPTIDAINVILESLDFQGFSIARTDNGTSYRLLRPDGSNAQETLSEGEKNFVTFLYFYHLLKGSDSDSGIVNDRIVVFDDPVSSLDSDILFVVGSLIKGLVDEVREEKGSIKQVFVLTHNIYFHKEVTFDSRRQELAMNEETFWIVRKYSRETRIEKYKFNPIKSSYELLWLEVRNSNQSSLTIQNTLRRILESYFKILGDIDIDEIIGKFNGAEMLICKSLFSWVNSGSHYAHEDLFVTVDSSTVDRFLKVFKKIFERTGHSAHYEMMMRVGKAQLF